jgi:hypothetical protein
MPVSRKGDCQPQGWQGSRGSCANHHRVHSRHLEKGSLRRDHLLMVGGGDCDPFQSSLKTLGTGREGWHDYSPNLAQRQAHGGESISIALAVAIDPWFVVSASALPYERAAVVPTSCALGGKSGLAPGSGDFLGREIDSGGRFLSAQELGAAAQAHGLQLQGANPRGWGFGFLPFLEPWG